MISIGKTVFFCIENQHFNTWLDLENMCSIRYTQYVHISFWTLRKWLYLRPQNSTRSPPPNGGLLRLFFRLIFKEKHVFPILIILCLATSLQIGPPKGIEVMDFVLKSVFCYFLSIFIDFLLKWYEHCVKSSRNDPGIFRNILKSHFGFGKPLRSPFWTSKLIF